MDPISGAMVSSILAPYIAKGGEAFVKQFGETAGQKIGELLDLVKPNSRATEKLRTS